MSKPRVFVTRQLPIDDWQAIDALADIEIWPDDLPPTDEVLREKIVGLAGLVCLLTDPIDAQLDG